MISAEIISGLLNDEEDTKQLEELKKSEEREKEITKRFQNFMKRLSSLL